MEFLSELWLAILTAAVLVFLASSVIHMMVPIHKNDFSRLPDEGTVLNGLRAARLPPGEYMFPGCTSMKDMGSPEMLAKYKQGPVGYMVLLPNAPPAIGKSLVQWFLYSLLIGVFVAYIARLVLPPGADYMTVFRITGTTATLAYGIATIPGSIWKGVKWSVTLKFIFDGVVYGLVTAGAFGWLWPQPF